MPGSVRNDSDHDDILSFPHFINHPVGKSVGAQ
jgi:hypothetical protein